MEWKVFYGDSRAYNLLSVIRSYLKNRIFVQSQGGPEFQPAGILQYFEDLKRKPNTEFGLKDIFEMASMQNQEL